MSVTAADMPNAADDAPLTFADYAKRIKTSRPYVSKLVAEGKIHGPALVPGPGRGARLIVPSIADAQRIEASPGDFRSQGMPVATGSALAREREGLVAAQRVRVEMENAVRRGDLVERDLIVATLLPAGRRLTERHKQALRDAVNRRLPIHEAEAALDAATLAFMNEIDADGGAERPAE